MGNFEFSHWDDRSRDKLVMICEEWEEGRVCYDRYALALTYSCDVWSKRYYITD